MLVSLSGLTPPTPVQEDELIALGYTNRACYQSFVVPVSPQASGERWGENDQMWPSRLSTAAVEVFLIKVLTPSLSAQRPRGGTVTDS